MNQYNSYIGIDCSDHSSTICVLNEAGNMVREFTVKNNAEDLIATLCSWPGAYVTLEAGSQSSWMSHTLREAGFDVLVADPRKLRFISQNVRKSDRNDARLLARMLRADPSVLGSAYVRGRRPQADLALVKMRDHHVRMRTQCINAVRGILKDQGVKLSKSPSAPAFAKAVCSHVPEQLKPALLPMLDTIEALNAAIQKYDKKIDQLCQERYPNTELLQSIPGVGPITSLTFVLMIENPHRFRHSRDVGAYFGLTARRDQSGQRDPQLPITKAGNGLMRRLLIQASHYILGPHGPNSALRDWGLAKAGNTKRTKRRAVVCTARKLAVLMHSLWINGTYYEAYFSKNSLPDAA